MKEKIIESLQGMPEEELQAIYRLIEAKKATYHRPLAFVQEMMKFENCGLHDGAYIYEMTVQEEMLNRYGILHGGLMTAFIDTAMAETAFAVDHSVGRALTLNLSVDFIAPGRLSDVLQARIMPIQNSRAILVFRGEVLNHEQKLLATALAHFYKQPRRTDEHV